MFCPKCDFKLMDDMGYGDAKCPTCGYIHDGDDFADLAKEVREQYKHQTTDEFLLT